MEIQDLKFQGIWRSYQERVLNKSESYLSDGKIHIVAAPGSGKTTLGIELLVRIGKPALILVPSLIIKEQWRERILQAFVASERQEEAEAMISDDLQAPAQITIATYQALHAANYDVAAKMKQVGVKVLCLDECHHLRSEWWTTLERFHTQMESLLFITLTATPPYDSSDVEWKRYRTMCGEIDEEITIPELVKEGTLCPHQDYVYFNYPTKDEWKRLAQFQENSWEMLETCMLSTDFYQTVSSHPLFSGAKYTEEMQEHPSYFAALLVYMKAKNQPVSAADRRLLFGKAIPDMNENWMEILLQNMLFDNTEDFSFGETYRETLLYMLKQKGLIEKRHVRLSTTAALEKALISSDGKADSVAAITAHEYACMGKKLRMLVLTDYIRQECESQIGTKEPLGYSLGVLPFFERLRREYQEQWTDAAPRLGVLCGSLVIIPSEAKERLLRLADAEEPGNVEKLTISALGSLAQTDYLKVSFSGNGHALTKWVTELFTLGYMQVLIGTKSLLGEGWDAPCINACILASFVGSYMLSNQMRGRALRIMPDNPDKTSNIWHLVCVKPPQIIRKEKIEGVQIVPDSEDWELISRRMEQFMGLHYERNLIVNGIERLSCIRKPFTEECINRINQDMLRLSGERSQLGKRWHRALDASRHMEFIEETNVKRSQIKSVVFEDALQRVLYLCLFLACVYMASGFFVGITRVLDGIAVITGIGILLNCPKLIMLRSPMKRLQAVGNGLFAAMKKAGYFEGEKAEVKVNHGNGLVHTIWLEGGTLQEKRLFSKCIKEIYAAVENQKYIFVQKRKKQFYCVPEYFAEKKERAESFVSCMRPYIGSYELIYTRNEVGRKWLQEGRNYAFSNQLEPCLMRKKVKDSNL